MNALWTISANPRRKARKSRKHRSAAQRAATARLVAMNRARRGGHKRRTSRRHSRVSSAARPIVIRTNPTKRHAVSHRSAARHASTFGNNLMGYIKTGAAGAGGALAVDAGYGFIASMLPASMQTKIDPATGGVNYMYYAGKGALATALGAFGPKFLPAKIAHAMAAGSFVVMMYELIRPMVAQALPTVNLGYFNPAPTMPALSAYADRGQGTRLGAYVNTMNKVAAIRSPMAK